MKFVLLSLDTLIWNASVLFNEKEEKSYKTFRNDLADFLLS